MKRVIPAVSTFKYGTGTIPAGDSSVDITHGAGSAPTHVSVTPGLGCDVPLEVRASEIGSTTFKVRTTGGVVLGADIMFSWGALI
jgi:hypothetical protein